VRHLLLGGLLGLAPRLIALCLYHDRPLEGTAAHYSLLAALGDLRWLPLCLWRAGLGDAVYLRYVGRLAIEPWPYWLLGATFIAPWIRHARRLPTAAWFTLLAASLAAVLVTLAAPYLAVRFMVVPLIGLTSFLGLCASAAIEEDARWRWPMAGAALGITTLNLFYCINDFYRPWASRELGYTKFFFGDRSKRTGNWAYYPKEELARQLLALTPPPEQIITVSTLERPLRVLLDGSPLRVTLPTNANPQLLSVLVDYRYADAPEPLCVNVGADVGGTARCFSEPALLGEYYVIYTHAVVTKSASASVQPLQPE
jgi:hypothetical protein